jgi:hypothetical protein
VPAHAPRALPLPPPLRRRQDGRAALRLRGSGGPHQAVLLRARQANLRRRHHLVWRV